MLLASLGPGTSTRAPGKPYVTAKAMSYSSNSSTHALICSSSVLVTSSHVCLLVGEKLDEITLLSADLPTDTVHPFASPESIETLTLPCRSYHRQQASNLSYSHNHSLFSRTKLDRAHLHKLVVSLSKERAAWEKAILDLASQYIALSLPCIMRMSPGLV